MLPTFHKSALLAPDAANPDALEFVASDETVDRYGDIIRVEGWELADYRRNPVVLFGHDSGAPIGTASRVWKDGAKLRAVITLAKEGTSELVNALRQLVAQKIIRAVSVGFRPTVEPRVIRDADDRVSGYEFIGQELLELSLVAVGANPHALAVAKSLNLSEAVINRTFAAVVHDGVQRRNAARAALDAHRARASARSRSELDKEGAHRATC